MAYDIAAAEQYIRHKARQMGIDENVAVRVARSEGLARDTYQSNVTKNGVREPSYGPFQLLVGGEGTGFPAGMGNDFIRQTGLDPRDPSTVNRQIDFALEGAAKNGWGAWYGAKGAGISNRQGIPGGTPAGNVSAPPYSGPDYDTSKSSMNRSPTPSFSQPPAAMPAQPMQRPTDPNAGAGLIAMLGNDDPMSWKKAKTFLGPGADGANPLAGLSAGVGLLAAGQGGGGSVPQIQTPAPEANAPDLSFMQLLQPKRKRLAV